VHRGRKANILAIEVMPESPALAQGEEKKIMMIQRKEKMCLTLSLVTIRAAKLSNKDKLIE